MKTLLQIKSSIFSDSSKSNLLSDRFVTAWRELHPEYDLVVRDLAVAPVPHLDAIRFGAFHAQPSDRTPEQRRAVTHSDLLVDELTRADVIVLALPMYNFGVPSVLKSYFDHIARPGVTFRYTGAGPMGLLTGKTAFVFATRGGLYAGTPRDTQTPYVRDFLRFLGIEDVEFVYAEGLSLGEARQRAALADAYAVIGHLIAQAQAAG